MTVKALKDDARYRLLVDAIVDYAVHMLDADGRVVSWNPGAELLHQDRLIHTVRAKGASPYGGGPR